jgi:phenolic acid decarboxylase
MAIQDFQAPYEIELNRDEDGNIVSVKIQYETHTIFDCKIALAQIPDAFYKVIIPDKFERKMNQKLHNENQFKVDYKNGMVYFHESLEGQPITISTYYGRGIKLLHAKRVLLEDLGRLYGSMTVEDFAKEVTTRINNLVLNTASPAEVTDAHFNSINGTIYSTLKQRLDNEFEDSTRIHVSSVEPNNVGNNAFWYKTYTTSDIDIDLGDGDMVIQNAITSDDEPVEDVYWLDPQ